MARQTKEFEVDGVKYSITHFTTTKGLTILGELIKIAAKPFGIFVENGDDADVTGKQIGDALSAVFENCSPKDLPVLSKDLLECISVFENDIKRPIIFDTDFAGNFGLLFKLIKEAIQFQFASFLGEWARELPALMAKAQGNRIKAR